jgi:hypothetical protein
MTKIRTKLSSEWQIWIVVEKVRNGNRPFIASIDGTKKASIERFEKWQGESFEDTQRAYDNRLECIKATLS